MIFPIQYGGDRVAKGVDGKEIKTPIHPKHALQLGGPIISVSITQPSKIAQIMLTQKKTVPSINIQALIDTGASGCIITDEIAGKLGLIQTGFQNITSVQDQQKRPRYFARIIFPWGKAIDVPVASCPMKGNTQCLIGRDVMVHWNLIYNGLTGQITICD